MQYVPLRAHSWKRLNTQVQSAAGAVAYLAGLSHLDPCPPPGLRALRSEHRQRACNTARRLGDDRPR